MASREVNGDALRAIRKLLGIEQEDLARRCGITQSALSRIEGGNRNPSPKVLRALADQLGVPLAAITSVVSEPVGS
jgi:XRE family transcriptional regulator, regulator of sulfur utilization